MSRSLLKDKYMRQCYTGRYFKSSKWDAPVSNPHRQDEMPKNNPSKFILLHCSGIKVDWLQDSTSFGGHSRPYGGHRRVSGLVRASLKREQRKEMLDQLAELDKKEY